MYIYICLYPLNVDIKRCLPITISGKRSDVTYNRCFNSVPPVHLCGIPPDLKNLQKNGYETLLT